MPGAAFACVVCKVQGWESAGLRVMIYIPAGAVFPSGCPEVPLADPRSGQADEMQLEGHFSTACRRVVGELRSSLKRFRIVLLDLGTFEAHICPRMAFLPQVGSMALGGGRCSQWSYYLLLVGGSKSKSLTF